MKRVLLVVPVLGLFLGAAAWPQDPPTFRDVLRGKVGQECQAGALYGTWTLWFPSAVGDAEPKEAEAEVPGALSFEGAVELVKANGLEIPDSTVIKLWQQALQRVAEDLMEEHLDGNVALVRPTRVVTLMSVGTDFVQLREEDGTERYVPMDRVEIVVNAAK